MAKLTIVYWRDIPTQVIAQEGRKRFSIPLTDRFIKAVDASAMLGGEVSSEDYMAHWRKDVQDCSEDLESEAKNAAERLENSFSKEQLRNLIKNKGVATPNEGN